MKLLKIFYLKQISLYFIKVLVLFFIIISFNQCVMIDDSPLESVDGVELGTPIFASGSATGNYFPYAKGLIETASQTLGIFMENKNTSGSLENATLLVTGDTIYKNAYMSMMQEDIFRYAQETFQTQYTSDPSTADKNLLKIASQIKVLAALYDEDVHLLINTNNIVEVSGDSEITFEDLLKKTSSPKINLGPIGSGTYVTAKTITSNQTFTNTPSYTNDSISDSIQKVISGEYDAAFAVTAKGSSLFQNISSSAPVKLVRVYMPSDKKYYDETSTIEAGTYSFQVEDISKNIKVKTLLVASANFDNKNIGIFLDYMFSHAKEFEAYNYNWEHLSRTNSYDYMKLNPLVSDFRAISYFAGSPEVDPLYLEPYFYSGSSSGFYHEMATELIWLLSHNTDVDLRERNSTGSWENSYRIMTGQASMTLVQEDIFSNLQENKDMQDSVQAANMQKVMPLQYEYLHVLINTESGNWTSVPSNLTEVFSNADPLYINVGPKTSGTFITAMKVINSYDTSGIEIHYSFDSSSDAVLKVNDGPDTNSGYHMMFVVSSVPYNRFYSHDTWELTTDCANCRLITSEFNGSIPKPYENGIIQGGGTATFENYPYSSDILSSSTINAVRVRTMLTSSQAFNPDNLDVFIQSVFRKGYYMTHSSDPSDTSYRPSPLWIPINKESMTEAVAVPTYYSTTYKENIVGAKEYFVKNPFGWSKEAVQYYLTMF